MNQHAKNSDILNCFPSCFSASRCRLLLLLLLIASVVGCDSPDSTVSPSDKDAEVPVAPAQGDGPVQASGPRTGPFVLETDGLAFDIPEGWREVELDAMARDFVSAKVEIPVEGSDAPLTISFSTAAGGIAANVQRWQGQFPGAQADISELSVNRQKATWVDIRGRFQSGVGSGPGVQEEWRMLGVAIPGTPRDFYIKLTGPRDQVTGILETFQELVLSARAADRSQ